MTFNNAASVKFGKQAPRIDDFKASWLNRWDIGLTIMNDEQVDTIGKTLLEDLGGRIRAARSILNRVDGVVLSRRAGPVRTVVRIRIGRRVDLRVKQPVGDAGRWAAGQRVVAAIPAEAVRLEAGLFRRSKRRWNRWYGRIVLVEPYPGGQVLTVKVHGEGWSLKSTVPIVGSTHRPQTWDPVNIVVDPEAIDLDLDGSKTPVRMDS
jgi:hypothetical protein